MGDKLPASPVRRLDRFVVALRSVWIVGWLVDDLVRRANGSLSPTLSLGLVLFLIAVASIELPFVYGIATGRRWGFTGLAVLSAMGGVGSITNPLMVNKPITALHVIVGIVDAALFVYCSIRLRQERVATMTVPRTTVQRFADALTGILGSAWALSVVVLLAPSLLRRPFRPIDGTLLLFFGLFESLYLAACVGVGLGRRWGFVAMIVMSVFVLIGLCPSLISLRPPLPQEIVVASFSGAAIVYCGIRLRPQNLDMAVKDPRLP